MASARNGEGQSQYDIIIHIRQDTPVPIEGVYVKPGPWTGLDHGLDWTTCDIETRNPSCFFFMWNRVIVGQ